MDAKSLNIIGDRATTVGNTWAGFESKKAEIEASEPSNEETQDNG